MTKKELTPEDKEEIERIAQQMEKNIEDATKDKKEKTEETDN
jgi:hypothetical protein